MVVNALPAILWGVALILSVIVCVQGLRGVRRYSHGDASGAADGIRALTSSTVWCHLYSVIAAAAAYLAYNIVHEDMTVRVRAWYEHVGVASAIVMILLVSLQFAVLILQARRLERRQMDDRLAAVARRSASQDMATQDMASRNARAYGGSMSHDGDVEDRAD